MPYVTADQVRLLAHVEASPTTDQSALINQVIPAAEKFIDNQTRTWWDSKIRTVKTEAVSRDQSALFMPAEIISISSITESGTVLAAADYVLYDSWIEKKGRSFRDEFGTGWSYWSPGQQECVIVGTFGYAAVPEDIKQATAEVAAMMAGLKVRSFTTDDGAERAVVMTALPGYVQDIIRNNIYLNAVGQRWVITA